MGLVYHQCGTKEGNSILAGADSLAGGGQGHNQPLPPSTVLSSQVPYDSHFNLPYASKLVLINARSVNNSTYLINDFIVDEGSNVACINETWLGKEDNVNLSLLCLRG